MRDQVLRHIRAFFYAEGFVEVDTPIVVKAPAPEPYIDAPCVTFKAGGKQFLQPSPELSMKRLIASGMERIFQCAAVFRDEDTSPQHRPEFRLLEWYRAEQGWQVLMEDCEAILRIAVEVAGRSGVWGSAGLSLDLSQALPRICVDAAFERYAGFSILTHLDEQTLRARLTSMGIPSGKDDTWNELFHRIFLNCVEPELVREHGSFFLTDYPAPLASLAQLSPDDPRVAERVELYVAGVELANGFGELRDANEQKRRFERDNTQRQALGLEPYPLNEEFLQALTEMPPTAGMALGFERLLMLLCGAEHMDAISYFDWKS
jgi:elongation factor P--(R)-beta-lysine ligase